MADEAQEVAENAEPPMADEAQVATPSIADKEAMLESLKAELAQSEASIESNFAKFASENLSAEDEELFFEDKAAFVNKLLSMQNEFIKSELGTKAENINKLSNEIANEKSFADMESAEVQFLEANPEADLQVLAEFYEQDLPQRHKAELDKLAPLEFLNALYGAYKAFNGAGGQEAQAQPQEAELPQRLSGMPSSADSTYGGDSAMSRF